MKQIVTKQNKTDIEYNGYNFYEIKDKPGRYRCTNKHCTNRLSCNNEEISLSGTHNHDNSTVLRAKARNLTLELAKTRLKKVDIFKKRDFTV
jgi:hypothetical protein